MTRRKIYSFAIDAELADGLKAFKDREGVAESEQIRRAIRAWLESKDVIKAQGKRAPTRKPR